MWSTLSQQGGCPPLARESGHGVSRRALSAAVRVYSHGPAVRTLPHDVTPHPHRAGREPRRPEAASGAEGACPPLRSREFLRVRYQLLQRCRPERLMTLAHASRVDELAANTHLRRVAGVADSDPTEV